MLAMDSVEDGQEMENVDDQFDCDEGGTVSLITLQLLPDEN